MYVDIEAAYFDLVARIQKHEQMPMHEFEPARDKDIKSCKICFTMQSHPLHGMRIEKDI